MADFSSGEMPEPMKQAIAEGRLTEEQAEEIMERIQSGEMPFGESGTGSPESGSSGQLPTMVPEDYQLKEGMTVTVNLIVSEAINVLLVPNAAITAQGKQSFVQVVTGNGTDGELITEQRAIETGITDYQFTEVTSGLDEGETILVPQGTATTVTSQGRRQGGVFFMGGPR
jgi:hypothetical protein